VHNADNELIYLRGFQVGNIPPQAILENADDGTIHISTAPGPTLLQGHAEVPVISTQGRLDVRVFNIASLLELIVSR
jgi:hypothetical protein